MMNNHQNMSKTPSSSTPELPAKRKRGRPRKDESLPRNEKRQTQTPLTPTVVTPVQPAPPVVITPIQPTPVIPPVTMNPIGSNNVNRVDPNMVGQVVTGVIDGIFDAGYLLSVRIGPSNNILRGVVFQQGHFCPITPANDVAPQVQMLRRGDFPVPTLNPRSQPQFSSPQAVCAQQPAQSALAMPMQHYQPAPHMVTGGSSTSMPPENLRMVQQDEVMQVFEVSNMVEEPPKIDDCFQGAKNNQLVSDTMAESSPHNEIVNQGGQVQGHHMDQESHQAHILIPQPSASVPEASQTVQDQVKHRSGDCDLALHYGTDDQPVVKEADPSKQPEEGRVEENPTITSQAESGLPVEPVMEELPSLEKDEMHQEGEGQSVDVGVGKVDINMDPGQAIAADLSQQNFPEREAK